MRAPREPAATRSSHDLHVVQCTWEQPGQRGADEEVVVVSLGLLLDPGELGFGHHRAPTVGEYSTAARIDHQQAHGSQVAAIRPLCSLGAVGLFVGGGRELAQQWCGITLVAPHPLVEIVGGEGGGRQIAEMLIHPVRGQRTDDALLPPWGGLDLVAP